MKKTAFRIVFGLCCFILMSILTFCSKENQDTVILNGKVKSAKTWFDINFNEINNSALRPYHDLKPIWEKAKILGENLEFPFMIGNGRMLIPRNEAHTLAKGRTRLIMKKIASDFILYIVIFIPSQNYNGDLKDLSGFNFKEKNYTGKMVVQQINSSQAEIFEIEKGRIIKVIQSDISLTENGEREKLHCDACTELCYYHDTWVYSQQTGETTFEHDVLICWCDCWGVPPGTPPCSGYSGAWGDPTMCPDPCLPWCN